jgi:parallel beta-helix repeat protein
MLTSLFQQQRMPRWSSFLQRLTLSRLASILLALIVLSTNFSFARASRPSQLDLPYRVYLPVVGKASLSGYFVSPIGNDTNPGTEAKPWRTMNKAAKTLVAGDTVYVRAGTYTEAVNIAVSGTADKPISVMAYPGEQPVIDGNFQLNGNSNPLVYLKGNWIRFSGFEVKNSTYMGIEMWGQHDVVDHVFVHHHMNKGIWVEGDYGTVTDSQLWQNAYDNLNNQLGEGSAALATARDKVDGTTDYAILRNNVVWENWGIGIDSYESNGTLIENNIVHDNAIGNIYVSDATNVICKGNFVYMTPGSATYGKNSNFGIMLGDEKYTPASANIQVINNIAYGNSWNFLWSHVRTPDGMHNVLIANNTFVNMMPGQSSHGNVEINNGSHVNVRFFNNIIIQDDSLYIADFNNNTGITFSRNIWSKTSKSVVLTNGDIVADAKLSRSGSPYDVQWYQLTSGSPAIHYALSLTEVSDDYLNNSRRTTPDAGALEFFP